MKQNPAKMLIADPYLCNRLTPAVRSGASVTIRPSMLIPD
jgi:hypothetical protein